jgi:hypothetical protein
MNSKLFLEHVPAFATLAAGRWQTEPDRDFRIGEATRHQRENGQFTLGQQGKSFEYQSAYPSLLSSAARGMPVNRAVETENTVVDKVGQRAKKALRPPVSHRHVRLVIVLVMGMFHQSPW